MKMIMMFSIKNITIIIWETFVWSLIILLTPLTIIFRDIFTKYFEVG